MTKGKKQQIESVVSAMLHPGVVRLSDAEYSYLGWALERGELTDECGFVSVSPSPQRPLGGFRRTPVGILVPTLWESLGIFDRIVDSILKVLRPSCDMCGCCATRGREFDPSLFSSVGYVAMVVDGMAESLPLKDQCELLGSERALVDSRVVRVEEIDDREGEAIVGLFAAVQREEMARDIATWFSRGGSPIRLMYLESRDAVAKTVQHLSRDWRCPQCRASFPEVSRQVLEDAEPCSRCRGEGWLLVDEGRYFSCEDCDGFGIRSPIASYRCGSLPLSAIANAPITKIRDALSAEGMGLSKEDDELLKSLCALGLGEYPLGMPEGLLSCGERAYITAVSAILSQLVHVRLVFDAGMFGGDEEFSLLGDGEWKWPKIKVFSPEWIRDDAAIGVAGSERALSVVDVSKGPLNIPKLEISLEGATHIAGLRGSGKSLLLSEIARRFGKRRKQAHLGSFGSLKRCVLLNGAQAHQERVISLVGLEHEVAQAASATSYAKERGLAEEDFIFSTSRHRCPECVDVRRGETDACVECGGSGWASSVGDVEVGGMTLHRLMTCPLTEAARTLWSSDQCAEFVSRISPELGASLCLGQWTAAVAPADRRFLTVYGGLIEITAQPKKIRETLVLIDNPFGMRAEYQRQVIDCMRELLEGGATIICAGVPVALEKLFSSVVRLELTPSGARAGESSRFFDARMSRVSVFR